MRPKSFRFINQSGKIKYIKYTLKKPFIALLSRLYKKSWARDIIYSALPKDEPFLCHTDEGLSYIVNSSDQTIGRYVYKFRKSFDARHLTNSLNLLGIKKRIILDVGANIGTIGIYAIHNGLAETCIAFEPEPQNYKLLRANVHLNGLDDKFDLHNVALASTKSDSLLFELSPSNFGDHRVRVGNNPGLLGEAGREVIHVHSDSLDQLISNIDYEDCILFMDTQGFEGDVLSGATAFIRHKVPIVCEFWPYGLQRAQGLEKFYTSLGNSAYTTLYDLRYKDHKMEFSIDAIKKIAYDLGDHGPFTDLLIF